MDPVPEAGTHEERQQAGRGRRRGRWLLATLILGFAIIASATAWVAMADVPRASPDAFRFDAIYVATSDPDAVNMTKVRLDMWFTNVDEQTLGDLRITAIVVDTRRNLEIEKSEHRLGRLAGRQTQDVEIEIGLNLSRPYRIDLLVLSDGLLVAKAEGGLGGYDPRIISSYEDSFDGLDATAARTFRIEYLNGAGPG